MSNAICILFSKLDKFRCCILIILAAVAVVLFVGEKMNLQKVVVNATGRHTATIIFLHGLGDTGDGWSEAFNSNVKASHVKCICPTAKAIPVTLNAGMRMPSWFDLRSLDPRVAEDENGIREQAKNIQGLIENEEKNGIPSNRIVLGGFSQGGALALYTALTSPKQLGGILALSSWLPLHAQFPNVVKGNKDTPILQCHGEADPMVLLPYGEMTKTVLSTFCSQHEYKTYPGMGHSSSPQELQDIKAWLEKVLPPV